MHILVSLGNIVCDTKSIPYKRMTSWWILVQKLVYLGFGHYRGFCLHDVAVKHSSFSARLARPKPIGEDRELTFRPVYIHAVCHVLQSEWIPVGWALLQRLAYIPRDCLLPTPSSTYQGCRRSELKYETVFALCKRILHAARSGTERSQSFGLISVGRRFCGTDEHTPLTNSRVFVLCVSFTT